MQYNQRINQILKNMLPGGEVRLDLTDNALFLRKDKAGNLITLNYLDHQANYQIVYGYRCIAQYDCVNDRVGINEYLTRKALNALNTILRYYLSNKLVKSVNQDDLVLSINQASSKDYAQIREYDKQTIKNLVTKLKHRAEITDDYVTYLNYRIKYQGKQGIEIKDSSNQIIYRTGDMLGVYLTIREQYMISLIQLEIEKGE